MGRTERSKYRNRAAANATGYKGGPHLRKKENRKQAVRRQLDIELSDAAEDECEFASWFAYEDVFDEEGIKEAKEKLKQIKNAARAARALSNRVLSRI